MKLSEAEGRAEEEDDQEGTEQDMEKGLRLNSDKD